MIALPLVAITESSYHPLLDVGLNFALGKTMSLLMALNSVCFILIIWLIVVLGVMVAFRSLQFVLLRVAESGNGPVLGLSGFLIGMGALVKFITA